MNSQVFDFKRVDIFVAKTTKSGIQEKSMGCRATPPVNAYKALERVRICAACDAT
jgi:hypothetical protein